MTIEEFLKQPHPEEFDFKNTVMEYSGGESAFKKYIKYKRNPGIDADVCPLNQEIYNRLWGGFHARLSSCISGDTMNSVQTTLNELCSFFFADNRHMNILRNLEREKNVNFELHKQGDNLKWSKERCYTLCDCRESLFDDILTEDAEQFLRVAYTIGNFIPSPTKSGRFSCNQKRGTGSLKDYWDLALYCIYRWYKSNEDRWLEKIFGKSQSCVNDYKGWLNCFKSWDDFVNCNYMAPFVRLKTDSRHQELIKELKIDEIEGDYGLPKELWKGHFGGPVLPSRDQIGKFFTNATKYIKARSELMVAALKGERQ